MCSENVDVPLPEAMAILKNTLCSLGYDDEMAELGAWSALWLEDRCMPGVTTLITYMLLVDGIAFEDLKPRPDAEHGFKGVCPFMLGALIANHVEGRLPQGRVAVGGTATPLLLAPVLSQTAQKSGKSLRLVYWDVSLLVSVVGVNLESEQMAAVCMLDTDARHPFVLEFVDERTANSRMAEFNTVSLPRARLIPGENRLMLNRRPGLRHGS